METDTKFTLVKMSPKRRHVLAAVGNYLIIWKIQ